MPKQKIKSIYHYIYYQYLVRTNTLIRQQRKQPFTIPIIIISFNQLFYLKKLIDFLLERGFKNIVIIDNQSTYPPLLEYFKTLPATVIVKRLDKNYGHNIMYQHHKAIEEFTKGYFVITDPDIVPNANLPENFMEFMINKLDQYFNEVTKVGFALKIDDIPEHFPFKNKVIGWESRFWENEMDEKCYLNILDTTFALYKPNYPLKFYNLPFLPAIRIAGDFTAVHGGWYKDPLNLTEEETYYQKTTSISSSWNFDTDAQGTGQIKY